jgi:two-component system, NtrC family, response regulator AtoC
MRKVAAKYECDPLPISLPSCRLSPAHSWPGNLRELENTIKRYLVLGDEQAIIDELVPGKARSLRVPWREDAGVNGA